MRVFTTQPSSQPGGKSFFYEIGVAFENRNGGGYSIELAAFPFPIDGKCRLVMLPPRDRNTSNGGSAGGGGRVVPPQGQGQQSMDDDIPW